MVWIEKTDSHVIVENVHIFNLSAGRHNQAVQVGEYPNIVMTQHVTIRHVAIESRHAYGIKIEEGSRDVLVEANDVRLDANREWVYGAVAMRDTHNVTFRWNHIDAYTSGDYRTVGLHLSDYFVSEARDATGLLAEQNTVVNATAGGIVSESSHGTSIRRNLVHVEYVVPRAVGFDYPRGISTEENSNETTIAENVIYTQHWGIQVGSDHGLFHSNTIYNVKEGIMVLDTGAWHGISSVGETIYNTTYWNATTTGIALPSNFTGTVVDLGPGIRSTNLTPVTLRMNGPASRVDLGWAGQRLNLSMLMKGSLLFDTANAEENQTLHVQWTGSIGGFNVTSFSSANVSFRLQSGAAVGFDGSGFPSGLTYRLLRSDSSGTSGVLNAQTTAGGILAFTIPAATPSNYTLKADVTPAVTTFLVSGTNGDNGWYTSRVLVTLSATDDLTGVQAIRFRTDRGPWQVYVGPVPIDGDGAHMIEYYTTDRAGNVEAARSSEFKVDTTPPVLASLAPTGTVTSHAVTFSWTASDATSGVVGYMVSADGAASQSVGTNTSWVVSLPDGNHVLEVRAVDAAGNGATARTPIRVDTNVFSLSGPDSGLPSFVLVGLGVAVAMFLTWRRRRGGGLPRFPRRTMEWLRSRFRRIR